MTSTPFSPPPTDCLLPFRTCHEDHDREALGKHACPHHALGQVFLFVDG